MIYTIGHIESYLQAIEEAVKQGRRAEKAMGGSVWRTRGEAEKHLYGNPDYAVFGVDAVWTYDTAQSKRGGDWHDLLRDAEIILLKS